MNAVPYAAYMICTSPRSGSTLLCRMLAATGQAGAPESHFHTPSVARWVESYGLGGVRFASDRERLAAIFEQARIRGSAGTGLFGLRMQRGSFPFFLAQAGLLYPDCGSDLGRVQAAFGRCLVVHLTRRSKLDQAISRVRAEQTGLWHRAADGTELERLAPPGEPIYDAAAIAAHLEDLSGMDRAWEQWFAVEGITPLRIVYEDLARDPGGAIAPMLRALGLDPAIVEGVEPPVAKLADDLNRDWAERFLGERGLP